MAAVNASVFGMKWIFRVEYAVFVITGMSETARLFNDVIASVNTNGPFICTVRCRS